ncbi:hypothetical protein F0344_00700 [Streptomyces finlayi]|uniref:Low temperature requirement protein A n=1 Tax=Streptomyces finlayi TaxID=67296 RepID=A0A7G7BDC3_9ACTN|nr:hypothetical protein [Streptomyces finlayi]QNE73338.1 hypothetical protein F0344_00700 [Streptomyces finlayi]
MPSATLASAATIGSGIEVTVEQVTHHAHISAIAAASVVTVPTALFVFMVWALHARHFKERGRRQLVLPVSSALVLVTTLAGHRAVPLAGLVCELTVALGASMSARRPDAG